MEKYRQLLSNYLGNQFEVAAIYDMSSLAGEGLAGLYFYGNRTESLCYLIAKENGKTIRVFIECNNNRENLKQLISGFEHILNVFKNFYQIRSVSIKQATANIWAEDEEILSGELSLFAKTFKAYIPDVPTSVYITIATLAYSAIKSHNWVETGLNIVLIVSASLLWVLIRALFRNRDFKFNYK